MFVETYFTEIVDTLYGTVFSRAGRRYARRRPPLLTFLTVRACASKAACFSGSLHGSLSAAQPGASCAGGAPPPRPRPLGQRPHALESRGSSARLAAVTLHSVAQHSRPALAHSNHGARSAVDLRSGRAIKSGGPVRRSLREASESRRRLAPQRLRFTSRLSVRDGARRRRGLTRSRAERRRRRHRWHGPWPCAARCLPSA